MPEVDIVDQLWKYIEFFYGGDVEAFASDVGQSKDTIYSYTSRKRKPGWDSVKKWVDAGMNPLWLTKDMGPMRWDQEDEGDVDLIPIGPPSDRARIMDLDEDDAVRRIADRVADRVAEEFRAEMRAFIAQATR